MKIFIASLLIFLSLSVSADAENVWYEATIETIYPLGDGNFVIIPVTAAPFCLRADKYLFVSDGKNGMSAEGVKNMLSVSLTAATLVKNIDVYYDKASTSCYVNRIQINF